MTAVFIRSYSNSRGAPPKASKAATWQLAATVLDLMRLRVLGIASPPFDYEVRHLSEGGHEFVIVRERMKARDGGDFPGAPGFVAHRYYYDDARERFELVRSEPENPSFNSRSLQALGNPLGFLVLHAAAVCNGRLAFLKERGVSETPVLGADGPTSDAGTDNAQVTELLDREADLNEKCRGGAGNDPATNIACEKRDAVEDQLKKAGMCHGHKGDSRAATQPPS